MTYLSNVIKLNLGLVFLVVRHSFCIFENFFFLYCKFLKDLLAAFDNREMELR